MGPRVPRVRIAVGCHPHNARRYDDSLEQVLRDRVRDPRVAAIGEIGLDYHYDLSPRSAQIDAFKRQLAVAHELGLPVVLHIREANDDALGVMREEGFPEAGTLLHCCTIGPDEARPWIEAGCYVSFGGALTFKSADAIRETAKIVPRDRLLVETDAPYMTPEPMRGMPCEPAHVVFTIDRLAGVLGCDTLITRAELLRALWKNARALLDRKPLAWQRAE